MASSATAMVGGSLDLILGCMFSGKSTELIRRIRMRRLLQDPMLVFTHASDTRYGNAGSIASHDLDREQALPLQRLAAAFEHPGFAACKAVFIEEAQFFEEEDLVTSVLAMVEQHGKGVVVCALDGDFRRQPFSHVLRLIPLADTVVKLRALCLFCKDGTPAAFSKRLDEAADDAVVRVGGAESYASVCRTHYLLKSPEQLKDKTRMKSYTESLDHDG